MIKRCGPLKLPSTVALGPDRAVAAGLPSLKKRFEFTMPKWCEGVISQRRNWSPGLFTIRIRVPDIEPFLPGQFLQLMVHHQDLVESEPKLINRPYSVASPHGDELEFFIVVVDGGELTPKLWELEEGQPIHVSQRAAGSFTLQKTPAAQLAWLFATGTGLAPYIAMLRTDYAWEKFQRIIVVHGVRKITDLAYTEELLELEQRFPGRFKLVQTLTRDQSPNCLTGRIPDLIENGSLEHLVGDEMRPETSSVLLCGNPAMLDSMEQLLGKRNMTLHRSKSPGQIVLERYW